MSKLIPTSKHTPGRSKNRVLTRAEFQSLADVPPEEEWFANIRNPNTRRAYEKDVREFIKFLGLESRDELQEVKRAHVIAWRKSLESQEPKLAPSTLRRKLSAVSSLYHYLCEQQAVNENPVAGVERPNVGANTGKTAPLGDQQTRRILAAPDTETLQGKRDAAILSLMFFSAPRRSEICNLTTDARQTNKGIPSLQVKGKGEKTRWIELAPDTISKLDDYLAHAGLPINGSTPLFQPVKSRAGQRAVRKLHPNTIYEIIVKYAKLSGIAGEVSVHPHTARSTATTNALENNADLKRTQLWLGHANIQTTTLYDHRAAKQEDSPTFHVRY